MSDQQYARELKRLVDEAPRLDLTANEVLALERAIFLLLNQKWHWK